MESDTHLILTDDPLLDSNQVAEIFQSTKQFVEKLRSNGEGPPFLKIGRLVRYRKSTVDLWLAEQVAKSTSEARLNSKALRVAPKNTHKFRSSMHTSEAV